MQYSSLSRLTTLLMHIHLLSLMIAGFPPVLAPGLFPAYDLLWQHKRHNTISFWLTNPDIVPL
jgi:hypothetical protein